MALSTSRTLVTKTGISTTQVFDMGGINISGGDFNLGSAIKLGNASGIITCTTFSGSGASLTNLPSGNLTGTVADARISTLTASKLSGALPAISAANLTNIPAANITGTLPAISGANLTGVLSDIVEDISPQLGGNLDVNTKNIVFGDSSGASDDRLVFGAGSDLSVYHDGTNSNITNTTNDLNITNTGDDIVITANDDINLKTNAGDNAVNILGGAAVELYHNASLKFETTSSGTRTTGAIHINDGAADSNRISVGNGGDLKIFHTNPNTFIQNSSAALVINAARLDINNAADNEQMARFTQDGAVELYHNNVKTTWTHGSGFNIKGGNTSDNTELIITGNEGQPASILMSADDGDDNADHWRMYSNADNSFTLNSYAGGSYQSILKGTSSRSIELNYQGSKKLETTSSGVEIHNDLLLDGTANLGNIIRTNYDGGGHMYHKNNSQGANYSSHFQTYLSSDEGGTTQTHIHYYHGGYSELLYQGNSSVRTRSGGGVEFRNGNSTKIGTFDPDGLKFGTDTAEANALDDYEEGNFDVTLVGQYGGNAQYSYRAGYYTRIGRIVHVVGDVRFNGSWSGSSGNVYIQLPLGASFASGGTVGNGSVSEWNLNASTYDYLGIQIDNNAANAKITTHDGNNNNTGYLQTGLLANNRSFKFGFTYITA